MRDALATWKDALLAAEHLKSIEGAGIDLGDGWGDGALDEFAELAGVEVERTLYVGPNEPAPHVIESVNADLLGVRVRAVHYRAARPGDETLHAHRSGAIGGPASAEEARAALEVLS